MSWKGERQRHQLAAKGIITKNQWKGTWNHGQSAKALNDLNRQLGIMENYKAKQLEERENFDLMLKDYVEYQLHNYGLFGHVHIHDDYQTSHIQIHISNKQKGGIFSIELPKNIKEENVGAWLAEDVKINIAHLDYEWKVKNGRVEITDISTNSFNINAHHHFLTTIRETLNNVKFYKSKHGE